jgi:thiol-disulfide isomerase/thioredoxin
MKTAGRKLRVVLIMIASWVLGGKSVAFGQVPSLKAGSWKAALIRQDGEKIIFKFDLQYQQQKPVIYIINDEERMEVRLIEQRKDSVFIDMPFFESVFKLRLLPDGSLSGQWIKATSGNNVVWTFEAMPSAAPRFEVKTPPAYQLGGRWAMTFTNRAGRDHPAIAELKQEGSKLTGSILTPSGDYRYLEGVVSGDSLVLSTFDGSHAYLFKARVIDAQTIAGGQFFGGFTNYETFTANKNESAELSMNTVAMELKDPANDRLNFRFPDLDGKLVGINDARFKGKVVVIQIMGSWCPNCLDETSFLSDYYKENRGRGLEMVALAYEYSTDFKRSANSIRRFQQKFGVQYPMLITGVTAADSLKTEKTLPQLTPIKSFPSTIFIGKDGRVKKVHGGFFGQATGVEFTKYVADFKETVNALLAE